MALESGEYGALRTRTVEGARPGGLAEAEKQLLATANLVRDGVPMVVSQQMRVDALIDSDARLYLRLQQLAESQDERFAHLAEVEKRTDAKLEHLADSIQKLVDSWKSGNGAH
jgi:hypothetical protein